MKKTLPFLILFFLPIRLPAQNYIFNFDTVGTHYAGDTITITIHGADSLNAPYTSIAYLHMTSPERILCLDVFASPNIIAFNSSGTYTGRIIIYRADTSLVLYVTLPIGTAQNNCPPFTILPGDAKKLQILLPGEANDPGNTSNRGRQWVAAFYDTAGIPFNATVYITDEYWNPRNAGNDSVSFGSINTFPILPADTFLTNGTGQFSFILRTASTNQTISVNKPSFIGDTLAADTSSPFTVFPGPFANLLLIAPSQTLLAGDTTTNTFRLPGATPDTTDWQVSGTPFNVTVYAVDDCWNPVGGGAPQDSVRVYGTIGPSTIADTVVLTGGNATVTLTSNVSNWLYLQATDIQNSSITTKYPTPIYVAGAHYRLEADEENDTIISGNDIHLHIYYEDESGTVITNGDHDVKIFVHQGFGSLSPTDTIVRRLTSGRVDPVVKYTTMLEENLYLEVASADSARKTTPGENVDPIHVVPNVTPEHPIASYPNPFGNEYKETTIYFYLLQACDVNISIYDRFGNLVWTREKKGQKGANFITWNGKNKRGKKVANGAYLLAIRATYRTEIIADYRRWLAVVK